MLFNKISTIIWISYSKYVKRVCVCVLLYYFNKFELFYMFCWSWVMHWLESTLI